MRGDGLAGEIQGVIETHDRLVALGLDLDNSLDALDEAAFALSQLPTERWKICMLCRRSDTLINGACNRVQRSLKVAPHEGVRIQRLVAKLRTAIELTSANSC
jgi:hypothetical protein